MATPSDPLARRPAPLLVGREREQAILRDALVTALAGRGSLVLIGGEAGIGKTALAEALLAEAQQQGALVLVGRCYDLTETPPYGPWTEAFARLAPTPDILPRISGAAPVVSQAALFAQARGELVERAARQPLVLLLDDVHWADPATLELLRFVARDLAESPILVVATYRSDELTRRHALYQLLPVLVREARAARVDLRRLDEGELRALVRARYGLAPGDEDRLVEYLVGRSEGNPFFAGELLRSLEEAQALRLDGHAWALGDLGAVGVPTLLRQVLDARLDRLGEARRGLLATAAMIGEEVPLGLWAAVAEVSEGTLLDVVERAAEAHLLAESPDGTRARFRHALIREALYEGTLPSRRRTWHRRVAEALLGSPAPDPNIVAFHLRQAGDPRAAEWLMRAGQRAQWANANVTAAERFEAALALLEAAGADASERGWLLLSLAATRRFADPARSRAYLDEAARAAAGDRALAATVLFSQGWLRGTGEFAEALPRLATGVEALEALTPEERARLALHGQFAGPLGVESSRGMLVAFLATGGRLAEALSMGERFLATVPALPGSPTRPGMFNSTAMHADAQRGVGVAYAYLGRPDEARSAFARARHLYDASGHHLMVGLTAALDLALALLPYQADRVVERRGVAAGMERAWQRVDSGEHAPPWRFAAAAHFLLEGNWAEVRALALVARTEDYAHIEHHVALGPLARAQGDPALAWAQVRGVLPNGPATEPGGILFVFAVEMQRLAAGLSLDAGDLPAARDWLAAHDRWVAWSGAVLGRAEGHLGWAAYQRAAGDLLAARQHANEALAHATGPRQPLALLAAHRTLGELATQAGHHAEEAAHLAEALALAEACAAPYERALTLLALAEQRAAAGTAVEARALLDEVRAICAPLEARPALARAAALAARLAVPAASLSAYPAGLTAREVEVLRLVAQGLTDAQVAARLFLSPRTVGRHLASIYNKLGVATRLAAARFALDHHLA